MLFWRKKKLNAKIIGVGSYLPEKILTNFDLEKMVDTSDEWITRRVGIKERHISREDEFTSDMAKIAAERALEKSGLNPEDIDLVLCSTVSAEMVTPQYRALQKAGYDRLLLP